ncbi:formate dehydrogenase accessory sulfurtransferase FdhD [Ideonella sp. YS5]|uniref:formate dehydrogenase accessory sulfurtransferase FdhD n=1 Tax=Ideonella sp. YS5 TaxID=3453714 RepID=UPI003EEDA0F7
MKPQDAALVPVGTHATQVTEWRGGRTAVRTDWLADEVPVALVFNGVSHAVMLASPADLEDFALGFALTEGLIDSPSELYGIEALPPTDEGITLQLEVSSACAWRLKERRRTLAGRTGCGLCGTDSLAQVRRALPRAPEVRVTPEALSRAQRDLRMHQAMQQLTGATHAAAWCGLDGGVRLVREDIGRHNALDKLIGAMLRSRHEASAGFAAITSRASFEMVQKAAAAGIGLLAAVSAPTSLAVRTALELDVALAGFVRGNDGVAYTHPERFGFEPPHGP